MRLFLDLLALVRVLSADRARLAFENVVLRQQLNVLRRSYNESRCHMALDGDAPKTRERKHTDGPIVAKPILGSLHHRYSRAA